MNMNKSVWILLLLAGVLSLGSCLKDEEQTPFAGAALTLNAVPGSEGLLVALDNNQLNRPAYGEFFRFGEIMPYRNVFAGKRLVRIFALDDAMGQNPYYTGEVNFDPEKFYTMVVAGADADSLEVFVIPDEFEEPEQNEALIRFIHLSPDAPQLDLGIEGETALVASAKGFKQYTSFAPVNSGEPISFYIKESGSDVVSYEFSLNPAAGRLYTIWAKGMAADLEHGVIQH